MPYNRVCHDPDFDWIFEGIDEDVFGDFGFSGHGAAGFELDRIDPMLDSTHNITILAQSYDTDNEFMLVPEEQLTHLTNLSGGPEEEASAPIWCILKPWVGDTCSLLGLLPFVAACHGIILTIQFRSFC